MAGSVWFFITIFFCLITIMSRFKQFECSTQSNNYTILSDTAVDASSLSLSSYFAGKFKINSRISCIALCSKISNCKSVVYNNYQNDNCYLYNNTFDTSGKIYSKGASFCVKKCKLINLISIHLQ